MSGAQPDRPWHWEGNIQATLARHLAASGWTVTATADTATKEPGIDLVAVLDGRWLAIEVKGYPSTTYEHGERRGQPKPTPPASQARQWYSHALLAMMLLRHKRADAEIAIALPAFDTFRRLVDRTASSFHLLGFGVYLIYDDGVVEQRIPHAPVTPPDNA